LLLISFSFWNGFKLFPESDNTQINIAIEATQWKKTESLEDLVPLLNSWLDGIWEIKMYTVDVKDNVIKSVVELYSKDYRADNWLRDSFKVEKEINEKLDIFRVRWYSVESWVLAWWPPGWKAVGIKIIADSTQYLSTLSDVSQDFKSYLITLEWTKNVWTSTSVTPGQFVFKLDYDKIAKLWLTPWEITNAIFANTNGLTAGTVKWLLNDHDIKVRIAEFENNLSPYDVENLVLNTSKWKIKLVDVASYSFETAISEIIRNDTKITTVVDSDLVDGVVQSDVQPKLLEFAQSYQFPVGISYSAWWEAEENADLIQGTLVAFFIALFLIFTILVLQFNSYGQPAIILYSVVLALLWVNTGLGIMWLPYSMAFAIWFIALTWIVINNAIIYIDRINTNLREWLKDQDAILQAGKSRLIPMLVTTITTIFGILPIALQDQFWAWLWFTIVFGLVTGTIMTLFVIPALYYQVFLKHRGWIWMILSFVITIVLFMIFNFIKSLFML
jgi:multidrug efflux pump subunit AcrB